jgi:hypothetical protein
MSTESQNGEAPVPMDHDQRQRVWDEMAAARRGEAAPPEAAPADQVAAPAAAAAPGEQQPAAPAAPAPAPAAPLTLEQLAAEIERKQSALERRVRVAEGHTGTAVNALRQTQAELAALKDQQRQRQAEAPAAAPAMPKWDRIKGDYEELAEGIDERIAATQTERDRLVREAAQRAAQEAATASERQMQRVIHQNRVDMVETFHPGWQDTCATAEFKEWLKRSSADDRQLADSQSPADAVRLLNRFKYGADQAPNQHLSSGRTAADLARERAERLQSAVIAPRSSAGSPSPRSEQDMTDAEYRAYLIAKKQRTPGARWSQ